MRDLGLEILWETVGQLLLIGLRQSIHAAGHESIFIGSYPLYGQTHWANSKESAAAAAHVNGPTLGNRQHLSEK